MNDDIAELMYREERGMRTHRYLVMRKESLINGPVAEQDMLHRSMFPVLVEMDVDAGQHYTDEMIVRETFNQRGWGSYNPNDKSYLVFMVQAARRVTFRPKRDYEVISEPF